MKPINTPTFILPRLIRLTAFCLIALIGIGYGLWQARYLIAGPAITIIEPPSIVQKDRVVTLRGTAQNAVKLLLNGRPIVTDPSGSFEEAVILENGAGTVSVAAYDRYGRIHHWEQPLVFIDSQSIVQR